MSRGGYWELRPSKIMTKVGQNRSPKHAEIASSNTQETLRPRWLTPGLSSPLAVSASCGFHALNPCGLALHSTLGSLWTLIPA